MRSVNGSSETDKKEGRRVYDTCLHKVLEEEWSKTLVPEDSLTFGHFHGGPILFTQYFEHFGRSWSQSWSHKLYLTRLRRSVLSLLISFRRIKDIVIQCTFSRNGAVSPVVVNKCKIIVNTISCRRDFCSRVSKLSFASRLHGVNCDISFPKCCGLFESN